MRQSPMCSAVCQQSHSKLPARTDQSRSVMGSSPLITHEITLSRSSAVTVMVPSSLRSLPAGHDQFTRSLRGGTRPARSVLNEPGLDLDLEDLADLGTGQVGPDLNLLGGLHAAQPVPDEGADLVLGHGLAGAELDDGGDALA